MLTFGMIYMHSIGLQNKCHLKFFFLATQGIQVLTLHKVQLLTLRCDIAATANKKSNEPQTSMLIFMHLVSCPAPI